MLDPPLKVARLMHGFKPFWCVAGGWAIDLFLGAMTRPHDDIEIAISRRDQMLLQKHLRGWTLKKATNGKLEVWEEGEILKLPVHEIHCFNKNFEPSLVEVLLNEFDENGWVFRRDQRITKSFSEACLTAVLSSVKFLSPEIVLLYKSKNPRPKDETDFENVVPRLDRSRLAWLKNALEICDAKNPWLSKLEKL